MSGRASRHAPALVPDAATQARVFQLLHFVEICAEADAPSGARDARLQRDGKELKDEMPSEKTEAAVKEWLKFQAESLEEDVSQLSLNERRAVVYCHAGKARSAAAVVAWLLLKRGVDAQYLQWLVGAMQQTNEGFGHAQKLNPLGMFKDALTLLA